MLCSRSPYIQVWMGCQYRERVKWKSRNQTCCPCSKQVCSGLEIEWCVCRACSKVFIKNLLFFQKTRRNDNRENNWRETTLKGSWTRWGGTSCEIHFRLTDEDMNSKLPTLIGKVMQKYQKAVKGRKENRQRKKNRQKIKTDRKKMAQENSLQK